MEVYMKKEKYMIYFLAVMLLLVGCSRNPSENFDISLNIESHINGSAYTHAKSTLKSEFGEDVKYENEAIISLVSENGEIDDRKIDASDVKIKITDGDGYYADQLLYVGEGLINSWSNGKTTFTLNEGDIVWNQFGYTVDNGGQEWSAIGGDGQGWYGINLAVEGLKYDGKEVEASNIYANVQIFGYDYTSDALELMPQAVSDVKNYFESYEEKTGKDLEINNQPVVVWVGEGEKPILCDDLADDIYIGWPKQTTVETNDVQITLTAKSGSELILTPGQDYEVITHGNQTQIGLNFKYWAYAPVYNKMKIDVLNGTVSEEMDIASVYVNGIQSGGGQDRDGTVVTMTFYGLKEADSLDQYVLPFSYILSYTEDGRTRYVVENEDGSCTLTEDQTAATKYDASMEDLDVQLHEHTVYYTERSLLTLDKEIDGKMMTLNKEYQYGFVFPKDMADVEDGYISGPAMINHKWAWYPGIEKGWKELPIEPIGHRYEMEVARGNTQKFTVSGENLSWEVIGNTSKNTHISEDGLLTVGEDEAAFEFAVTVYDPNGQMASVAIRPK